MSNENPQATYGQYKLREIIKSLNVWGITIPMNSHEELLRFKNVKFTISVSGNNIILASGQDIAILRKQTISLEELQNA